MEIASIVSVVNIQVTVIVSIKLSLCMAHTSLERTSVGIPFNPRLR